MFLFRMDYSRNDCSCQEKGNTMTFSEHLLYLRTQRHLKQTEVAAAVHITERGYRNYEQGLREPTLSTLVALADFYGISVDELICHTPKTPA